MKNNSYFRIMKQKKTIYCLLWICMLLSAACSHPNTITDSTLRQTDSLQWCHLDSATALLQTISPEQLCEYDHYRYTLLCSHLLLKNEQRLPPADDMSAMLHYFEARQDEACIGEVLYIQGAYENRTGDDIHAMEHFKQAEQYATTPIIRGMTYYKMGRISEDEQLYDVAAHYYEKALPYLQQAHFPLYLASVYRELGRTATDTTATLSVRSCYMDSALYYARQTGDTLLYLDALYAATLLQPDTPKMADICRYLCRQGGQKRYAYDLAKYYIRIGEGDSARVYLDILSQDSTQPAWSQAQYRLWQSRYLHLHRQDTEAYNMLLALYNERIAQMDKDGAARAFLISQRYDNELEHSRNLQLEIERQHLYISITLVVIATLLLLLVFIIILSRHHTRTLLQQEQDAKRIENLNHELNLRRSAMKQVLEQRLTLTKSLQEAILHKRDEEKVPQWAKPFIETNIFSTEGQWKAFLEEFDDCHYHFLAYLHTRYPRLTETDMQVIALMLLGLDISDICLLLGSTQRTIWSRRQRIKKRMDISENIPLEKYLQQILQKVANSGYPM